MQTPHTNKYFHDFFDPFCTPTPRNQINEHKEKYIITERIPKLLGLM